jgi:hypothetical protein
MKKKRASINLHLSPPRKKIQGVGGGLVVYI